MISRIYYKIIGGFYVGFFSLYFVLGRGLVRKFFRISCISSIEKFEGTKGIIRNHRSKNDRQYKTIRQNNGY